MAFKLGRRHPDYSKPRLWAEDYYALRAALPQVRSYVDFCSEVWTWPMYGNDRIGDCTLAGYCHSVNAWSKYSTGVELVPPDYVPLQAYEAVGHYVPGNPATDNGCVMQDVLQYAHTTGIPPADKLLGYAQLKDTSPGGLNVALQLFGSVYLGLNLPQSAETQFGNQAYWSYVQGSPIIGGHCVVLQKIDTHARGNYSVVTWGAVQRATLNFMHTYLEEAWVMLSPHWLKANGNTISGLNAQALQMDMQQLAA